ncbi:YaaC family protein [Salipaludibacillus daqingensis]|uniref:YaaC family protein n=1 Tax=Salipaludibacillus daqingensis TaxID=3041001 RepID=UPI0024731C1B|nr:YaaC family protein [Salipaludibacillus daqingensis]
MKEEPSFTTVFQSAAFAKQFLLKKYTHQSFSHATEKAFHNCYSFIYYIQIGDQYFHQGKIAPLSIKPVLLFYGLSHWLKAALLIVDPDYPATTQVLAHGLSTRKRKKKGYEFLSDDVRIQKDGLFPYLSNILFHVKQLSGEKRTMRQLLFNIPEMMPTLQTIAQESGLIHLKPLNNQTFSVQKESLKRWDDPLRTWIRQLSKDVQGDFIPKEMQDDIQLTFLPPKPNRSLVFRYRMDDHIFAPVDRSFLIQLPELLIHYALLYQLSMICRYEAEWWGELIYSFSFNDLPIITDYLHISQQKCPWLLNTLFFD